MPISEALFAIIPIGEENAVSGRLLWKQLGMWSAQSVKHKLNQLAAQGLIERKRIMTGAHESISDREPKTVATRVIAPADAEPESGRTSGDTAPQSVAGCWCLPCCAPIAHARTDSQPATMKYA